MPQRDLVAELSAVRLAAPPEVRERVRLIAAAAPPERRRRTWRLAFAVAVPVAAAVAAAVVFTRPSHHAAQPPIAVRSAVAHGAATMKAAPGFAPLSVPTTPKRVQTVGATISLRVQSVSDAVKRAVAVAASLSGYAASVHATSTGTHGAADLTLKVPRTHVQSAIARLSALGTIVSESVDLTDRQAGLNADARTIARLRAQLAAATDPKQRAAIVMRIQAIQRRNAATRRTAHYATLHVHLATPTTARQTSHAWRDAAFAGLGAAALALLLAAWRVVRRLREDRLLSRS